MKRAQSKTSKPASKAPAKASSKASAKAPTGTKKSQLIALLSSGASMAQMTELTGWLPHTVRGMLSGSLRKRLGLNVQHSLQDGVRVYRIVPAGEAVAQ